MRQLDLVMVVATIYAIGAAGAPFVESLVPHTNRLLPRVKGGRELSKSPTKELDGFDLTGVDRNKHGAKKEMEEALTNFETWLGNPDTIIDLKQITEGDPLHINAPEAVRQSPLASQRYKSDRKNRKERTEQRAEDRKRKAEDRKRKAEDRKGKAEDRKRKEEAQNKEQLERDIEMFQEYYTRKTEGQDPVQGVRLDGILKTFQLAGIEPIDPLPEYYYILDWIKLNLDRKRASPHNLRISWGAYKTLYNVDAKVQQEISERRRATDAVQEGKMPSLQVTTTGDGPPLTYPANPLDAYSSSYQFPMAASGPHDTLVDLGMNHPATGPYQGPGGSGTSSQPGPSYHQNLQSSGESQGFGGYGQLAPAPNVPHQSYGESQGSSGYGQPAPVPNEPYQRYGTSSGSYGNLPGYGGSQGSAQFSNPYDSQDLRKNPFQPQKQGERRNKRDLSRRGLPTIQEIADTATTSIATQNSEAGNPLSNDMQEVIRYWKATKSKAQNLIWPILTEMLMGTNSTIIIGAAWSIYAHLIPTLWNVFGPFFYGLTSLPILDENATINNDTGIVNGTDQLLEHMLLYDIVNDLHAQTYDKAFNTLNQSGCLKDLEILNSVFRHYNKSLPFVEDDENKIGDFFKSRMNRSVPAGEWGNDSSISPFKEYGPLNTLLLADYIASSLNTSLTHSGSIANTSFANTTRLAHSS